MDLQRCGKGHFYDADRNSVCPHCITNDRLDAEQTVQALPIRKGRETGAGRDFAPDRANIHSGEERACDANVD